MAGSMPSIADFSAIPFETGAAEEVIGTTSASPVAASAINKTLRILLPFYCCDPASETDGPGSHFGAQSLPRRKKQGSGER